MSGCLGDHLCCGLEPMVGAARMAGMDANTLFSQALGLGAQWKVVHSEMDVANRRLCLELDFTAGLKAGGPK